MIYGIVDKRIGGYRHRIYAHRLSLMIHMQTLDLNRTCEYSGLPCEVSHLCHNALCINPLHLSLEPKVTNNSRKQCLNEKKCFGHGNYRACLLDLHVVLPGGGNKNN